ncbi:TPA: hypothetical protein ACH3X3_005508 [Trebouxia sp. C0006]
MRSTVQSSVNSSCTPYLGPTRLACLHAPVFACHRSSAKCCRAAPRPHLRAMGLMWTKPVLSGPGCRADTVKAASVDAGSTSNTFVVSSRALHDVLGVRSMQACTVTGCDQKLDTTSYCWQDPGLETDIHGVNRVPYRDQGWNFWNWQKHRIHYVQAGSSGPPIVLVHGFGASAYHWRYNIIELAKEHRVFAVDLLGFGWSDKALVDYSSNIWSDQIAAFIREVVDDGPVVLAGNSLGGYNSLATAARYPELVKGVVLLNGAGRIEDVQTAVEAPVAAGLSSTEKDVLAAIDPADFSDAGHTASGMTRQDSASRSESSSQSSASQTAAPLTKSSKEQTSFLQQVLSPLATVAKRVAVYGSFILTKQPSRVKQVLQQVYIDKTNVDDDLVNSIIRAAEDPNAAEVFYRVIGGNSGVTGGGASVNQLLNKLDNKMPMLLLWGDLDPWIGPGSAARVKKYYPKADRVGIQAGHCPHDEKPAEVDRILVEWADKL